MQFVDRRLPAEQRAAAGVEMIFPAKTARHSDLSRPAC